MRTHTAPDQPRLDQATTAFLQCPPAHPPRDSAPPAPVSGPPLGNSPSGSSPPGSSPSGKAPPGIAAAQRPPPANSPGAGAGRQTPAIPSMADLLDALPIAVTVTDGISGQLLAANQAARAILGATAGPFASPSLANADLTPIPQAEHPIHVALAAGARAESECFVLWPSGERRWTRISAAPQGTACIAAYFDLDEQHRLLRHQRTLLSELSHRVKNSLAVVSAIGMQSAMDAKTMPAFQAAFQARLRAISTAHTLLLDRQWRGTTLRELAAAILSPAGTPLGVSLTGPEVPLTDKQTLALAMLLQELAMLAAATTPPPIRKLIWDVRGQDTPPCLAMRWEEHAPALPAKVPAPPNLAGDPAPAGLPPPQHPLLAALSPPAPKRESTMGRRLIQLIVANDLGGSAVEEHFGATFSALAFTFPLAAPPAVPEGCKDPP